MSTAHSAGRTAHALARSAGRHGAHIGHAAGHGTWQIAGIVATVAVGVAVTSGGVYAALTADATNGTAQQVTSGTLLLTLTNTGGGAGFTSQIANIAPGDVVNRYVTLTNTGTLAGQGVALSLTDSTPTLLTTSTSKGLQVAVTECSVAWVPGTGSCGGTATPVLAATSAPSLTQAAPASLTTSSLAALTGTRYYQVSTSLPSTISETTLNGSALAVGSTIQGLTANLTYRFTETQRAGTTVNS